MACLCLMPRDANLQSRVGGGCILMNQASGPRLCLETVSLCCLFCSAWM